MSSESRAIAAFTGVGVLLVAVAIAVVRYGPERGVAELPSVPATNATLPNPPPHPELLTLGSPPLLLQHPSLSATAITFDYAGEIWIVARAGGEARRLVTGQLRNSRPIFSPDGTQIAFTGMYDRNTDVYVVPAAGGEPRRLTLPPVGRRARRLDARRHPRAFPLVALHAPRSAQALHRADHRRVPRAAATAFGGRGQLLARRQAPRVHPRSTSGSPSGSSTVAGRSRYIWVADLSDSHVVKVPHPNANDRYPMWVGDTVYFVSDRDGGTYGLFAYDVKGGSVREVLRDPGGVDVHFASAGPGGIVCERLDGLYVYDLTAGKSSESPSRSRRTCRRCVRASSTSRPTTC